MLEIETEFFEQEPTLTFDPNLPQCLYSALLFSPYFFFFFDQHQIDLI